MVTITSHVKATTVKRKITLHKGLTNKWPCKNHIYKKIK